MKISNLHRNLSANDSIKRTRFLGHHKKNPSAWEWEQNLLDCEDYEGERCLILTLPPRLQKQSRMEDDEFEVKTILNLASIDDIKHLNVFNDGVIGYLQALSEFAYYHQDVSCHIRLYIQQKVAMDPSRLYFVDKGQLQHCLSYLAFTEDFAEKAVQCISDNLICSQDTLNWATFVLEILERFWHHVNRGLFELQTVCLKLDFLSNWELSDQGGYMYNKGGHGGWCKNEWFCHNFQSPQQDGACAQLTRNIKVFNLSDKNMIPEFQCTGEDKIYFHATKWGAVDDILKTGIHLGSRSSDFSNDVRPGFYISDNFDSALEWGQRFPRPAVIVFKVEKNFFEGDKHVQFDRQDREELYKVFQYFRNKKEIKKDLGKRINKCWTITGPILSVQSLKRNASDLKFFPDVTQTCILDEDIACRLLNAIDGIVYVPEKANARAARR